VSRQAPSFPLDAARDLLGVVRALYAAQKHVGVGPERSRKTMEVGRKLGRAIALAAQHAPGTEGHDAAWALAEQAAAEARSLTDILLPADRVVAAGAERVRRRREEKKPSARSFR
jgi:hypothetical protein